MEKASLKNEQVSGFCPLTLTKRGLLLEAKLHTGIPLQITRAVIGSGYLDENENIADLTELKSEIMSHQTGEDETSATVDISRVSVIEAGVSSMRVTIKSGDAAFYLREIGIMAQDPDLGEILYMYTTCGSGAAEGFPSNQTVIRNFDFIDIISNASEINVNVTLPSEVSYAEFVEHKDDTGNPHKTTAKQLGLDKVPNVATNDQEVTYEQAKNRNNIESGEKLSIAFGKIKKWFSDLKAVAFSGSYNDLIDKLNTKKNPNATDGDIIDTHLTIGTRYRPTFGAMSFTSGNANSATSPYSVSVGGIGNEASGNSSATLGGSYNTAKGIDSVVVGGDFNIALDYQFKIGHYAKEGIAGTATGTTGDVLIAGNGTSDTNRSNAFRVAYNGNAYGLAAFNSTGADYAEYFEWADGNPNNEDRRGLFAYIENGKMRLATSADTDKRRLGVISARPAVVGDNYDDDWHGKYMTDIFGEVLTKTVHLEAEYKDEEVTDHETGETKIVQTCIREECDAVVPKINPDYDDTQEYIPRAKRKEYDCWAFMGKLVVIGDGTCEPNGYCYPKENGIATSTEDGYYVMDRLDDKHIRILLK